MKSDEGGVGNELRDRHNKAFSEGGQTMRLLVGMRYAPSTHGLACKNKPTFLAKHEAALDEAIAAIMRSRAVEAVNYALLQQVAAEYSLDYNRFAAAYRAMRASHEPKP
jgi:hypothetical protein